jgi:hypothetical protein
VFDECCYNSGSDAINIAPENHELDKITVTDLSNKQKLRAAIDLNACKKVSILANKAFVNSNNFEQPGISVINMSNMTLKDVKSNWKLISVN